MIEDILLPSHQYQVSEKQMWLRAAGHEENNTHCREEKRPSQANDPIFHVLSWEANHSRVQIKASQTFLCMRITWDSC